VGEVLRLAARRVARRWGAALLAQLDRALAAACRTRVPR